MEALLIKYGYSLLFFGVMVEGEAFLLGASVLAHRGLLRLPVVILVAIAANTVIDQVYYVLARARGRSWLEQRYGSHSRYARLTELMGRHGAWLLVVSRFAFGFRILIPAACGALGMSARVFVPVNVLAGALWAVPTALLGYYGGGALGGLLADVQHHQILLGAALLGVPALVVSMRQARRVFPPRELRASDFHSLVPVVIGLMGCLNVASAILPRPQALIVALADWLPLEVMQRSRPPMLFAGIALLQVTRSLSRRKALAWWVAVVALLVSLVSHAGRAFDLHHSLVAALLLAYLVVFRRRFNAQSDPTSLRLGLVIAVSVAASVVAYGDLGLRHMHDEFRWDGDASPLGQAFQAGILTLDPDLVPLTPHAARFVGSLQIAGWLGRLYLLVLLLRPVILRDRQEAAGEAVQEIFRAHGHRSLSAFAVQEDKHHLLVAEGRGLVAFAVRGSVVIACGDPLASGPDQETAVAEYLAHASRQGWTPCVYEAAEEQLPVYRRFGLRTLKMAEEAILDLPEFSLAGGKRAALRSMCHKVARAGLVVMPYDRTLAADPVIDEQLEEISEEWLAEKRLGELGFSLGRFSLEALAGAEVFVALIEDRVLAFCSWLAYRRGQGVVVDLMRKRRDAVSGTMDLLLAEALLALKAKGYLEASLANAPLANVGAPRTPLDRGVALLFERLNGIYGYKNLFQFKKKFAPRWEGRYLVYPGGADLPRVTYALTRVHGAGGLRRLLLGR